ncbi:MAG: CdaR family protein [Treponemataceae bacterium]
MKNRKLIDRIVHNWPIKVLSVAAAVILFTFNRMSALEERFFSVPLRVSLDGTLVPSSSYPRMVRITLRGESNNVFPILEEDIEAYIDFSKYRNEGVYKAAVLVKKKGTAAGVDPLEIHVEPMEVAVSLEHKESKVVPVTPSFRGYLENGYELAAYAIEPTQTEIIGPASIVNRVQDVTTDSIELTGKKESFEATVKIVNREPLIAVSGDSKVRFKGTIQQSVMIRTFEHLPIVISGLPSGFKARPQVNFGSIKLQGSQNDLESYLPDASLLSIDCSNVNDPGLYILPVIISAPPNFSVIRFDPVEIAVEVERDKSPQGGEGR